MDKLKYVAKRLNMLPYRSEAKKEIVEFAKEKRYRYRLWGKR